jgi:uncharacterized cupredoxin-like copper-binding protein
MRARNVSHKVVIGLMALGLLGACSDDKRGLADDGVLGVSLSEWAITPESLVVPAGDLVIRPTNTGGTMHEMVLVRTDEASDSFPITGADEIDEEIEVIQAGFVDEIEDIPAGTTTEKVFALTPGNYVLFCNVTSHYAKGMNVAITAA